jgi:hypothetical protein
MQPRRAYAERQLRVALAVAPMSANNSRADAERRLFMAVLEDAIRLIRKGLAGPAYCVRFAQADLDWIFSEDRDWPCSFVNVCGFLGIESEWVRGQVLKDIRNEPANRWPTLLRAAQPSKLHLM